MQGINSLDVNMVSPDFLSMTNMTLSSLRKTFVLLHAMEMIFEWVYSAIIPKRQEFQPVGTVLRFA